MRLRLFRSKITPQYELDGEITTFPVAKNVNIEKTIGNQYLVKTGELTFELDQIISLDSNRVYWIMCYEKKWTTSAETFIGIFRMLDWHEYDFDKKVYKYRAFSAEQIFLDELNHKQMVYNSSALGDINDSISVQFSTNYNVGTTPPICGIKSMPYRTVGEGGPGGANSNHVFAFNPVNILGVWHAESFTTDKFEIGNVIFGSSSGDPVLNYDGIAEGLWYCRGRSTNIESNTLSNAISHNFTKKGASLSTSGGFLGVRKPGHMIAEIASKQAPSEPFTWGEWIRAFMYCANLTLIVEPIITGTFAGVKINMSFETWGTEQNSSSWLPHWTKKVKYKPDMYKLQGVTLTGDNFTYSVGQREGNDVLQRDVFLSEWYTDFIETEEELPYFFLRLGTVATPSTATDSNGKVYGAYNWSNTQNPVDLRFAPSYAVAMNRSRGYEGEILWDGEELGSIVKFAEVGEAWGGGASDYDILFITKIVFKGKKIAVISGKVNGEWIV